MYDVNQELPLRGILNCSCCGSRLTGSRSRGRLGTRYAYYHCNHCGNERYRTDEINRTIEEILDSWKLKNGFDKVYQEMVKRLLNEDGGSKVVKKSKLKATIQQNEERIQSRS